MARLEDIAARIRTRLEVLAAYDPEESPETLRQWAEQTVRDIRDVVNDVAKAVDANEASSLVADALPVAAREYQGRFVATMGTGGGGEDELYWCKWDGAAYAWEKII